MERIQQLENTKNAASLAERPVSELASTQLLDRATQDAEAGGASPTSRVFAFLAARRPLQPRSGAMPDQHTAEGPRGG